MASHNRSVVDAFGDLNIITALAMMVYMLTTLVLLGIAGEAIDLMEEHRWLPLTATLGVLVVIFLSSGTRDPNNYHPAEVGTVLGSVLLMGLIAFVDTVSEFVVSHDPISSIVLFIVYLIAAAILAR